MKLDGTLGDAQIVGDLLILQTLRQEQQHVELARRDGACVFQSIRSLADLILQS